MPQNGRLLNFKVIGIAAGWILAVSGINVMAQTVQLPTQQRFSVGTSVWVPDQGTAFLGGVNRTAVSSTSRGLLLPNRSIGSSIGSSNAYITAKIIDLRELDRQVLAEARRQRNQGSRMARSVQNERRADERAIEARARFLSRHVSRNPNAGRPVSSRIATSRRSSR